MEWKWMDPVSDEQKIKHVTAVKEKDEQYQYRLNWHWPRGITNVYIDTRKVGEEVPLEQIELNVKNVYTVAQYQRFQGFRNKEILHKGENHTVRVFPVLITEGHQKVIVRQDDDNQVFIQSPKAKVQVIINEKKSLFKRTKDVEIIIYSHELDIKKEALCYIRKSGSKPLDIKDGFYNEFINDIKRGTKMSFQIDGIPKHDHINVFLTDLSTYKDLFVLTKEFN